MLAKSFVLAWRRTVLGYVRTRLVNQSAARVTHEAGRARRKNILPRTPLRITNGNGHFENRIGSIRRAVQKKFRNDRNAKSRGIGNSGIARLNIGSFGYIISFTRIMELLSEPMGQAVADAFKQLLSEKHLYQSIEVDLTLVSSAANVILKDWQESFCAPGRHLGEPLPETRMELEKSKVANGLWMPRGVTRTPDIYSSDSVYVGFELPTINTFCDNCEARWPFNPVSDGSYLVDGSGQDEFFYLGYQCQQCKGEPIRFLVRREGLKLRLAGRYPLEVLPTPKVLPKSVSKFYGSAMIAHHAGQTLAGLFLLRVFIEQFWRTVPAVQKLNAVKSRANGDEQGDAYQSMLPPEFKSRFPSLKDIYSKLSEAIHSANEDAKLFDDSCAKIEEHFDALRVFKIMTTGG
jgi:hypothetical protein